MTDDQTRDPEKAPEPRAGGMDPYVLGLRLPDGRLVTLQEFLDEHPELSPLEPSDP